MSWTDTQEGENTHMQTPIKQLCVSHTNTYCVVVAMTHSMSLVECLQQDAFVLCGALEGDAVKHLTTFNSLYVVLLIYKSRINKAHTVEHSYTHIHTIRTYRVSV